MKQYTPEAEATFESDLDHMMGKVRSLLLEKNKAYGDSEILVVLFSDIPCG